MRPFAVGVCWWPCGRKHHRAAHHSPRVVEGPRCFRKCCSCGEYIVHKNAARTPDLPGPPTPDTHRSPDSSGTVSAPQPLLSATSGRLQARQLSRCPPHHTQNRAPGLACIRLNPPLGQSVEGPAPRMQTAPATPEEQQVYRTEPTPYKGRSTARNRHQHVPGAPTSGRRHGLSQARGQYHSHPPVARAFESEEAQRQLITVGPRGHHSEACRPLHVNQGRRQLFRAEWTPAKLAQLVGTGRAQGGVFSSAAYAVFRHQKGPHLAKGGGKGVQEPSQDPAPGSPPPAPGPTRRHQVRIHPSLAPGVTANGGMVCGYESYRAGLGGMGDAGHHDSLVPTASPGEHAVGPMWTRRHVDKTTRGQDDTWTCGPDLNRGMQVPVVP